METSPPLGWAADPYGLHHRVRVLTEWGTEGVSALHTECGRMLDPVPVMPSVAAEATVCEECVEPEH